MWVYLIIVKLYYILCFNITNLTSVVDLYSDNIIAYVRNAHIVFIDLLRCVFPFKYYVCSSVSKLNLSVLGSISLMVM